MLSLSSLSSRTLHFLTLFLSQLYHILMIAMQLPNIHCLFLLCEKDLFSLRQIAAPISVNDSLRSLSRRFSHKKMRRHHTHAQKQRLQSWSHCAHPVFLNVFFRLAISNHPIILSHDSKRIHYSDYYRILKRILVFNVKQSNNQKRPEGLHKGFWKSRGPDVFPALHCWESFL